MAYFRNVPLNIEDFSSSEEYERALIEQERIEKILSNVDITDPHVAMQLYEGFAQHPEMFRSIVGTEFMEVLAENSKDNDRPVEAFVYNTQDNAVAEAAESQDDAEDSVQEQDRIQESLQQPIEDEHAAEFADGNEMAAMFAEEAAQELSEDDDYEVDTLTPQLAAEQMQQLGELLESQNQTSELENEFEEDENQFDTESEAAQGVEGNIPQEVLEDAQREASIAESVFAENNNTQPDVAMTDVDSLVAASQQDSVSENTTEYTSQEAQEQSVDTDFAENSQDIQTQAFEKNDAQEQSASVSEEKEEAAQEPEEEIPPLVINHTTFFTEQKEEVKKFKATVRRKRKNPFPYMKLIRRLLMIYPFILLSFPMAGLILLGLLAAVAFIKIWGSYINNHMKFVDIVKSLLCIVVFPVGLILSVLGIMKKIKYMHANRRAVLYSFILYVLPVFIYCNIALLVPQAQITTLPAIGVAFVEASILGKAGIIMNICLVIALLLFGTSRFADSYCYIIYQYIEKGLTQGQAIQFVAYMPVMVLCMFKALIDGKMLYEEQTMPPAKQKQEA